MRTAMTLFLLLTCSLALGVAQDPNQPQVDQQTSPSSSEQAKNVTIVGCLQQGVEADSYVLNNAQKGDMGQQTYQGQDQTQPEGERPDQTPSELARTQDSYKLVPDARVDLKNYVGQRVEISGEIIHSADSKTVESTQSTTPSGQSSSGRTETISGQQHLRVSSVKALGGACQ